jgi:hypothetical protein
MRSIRGFHMHQRTDWADVSARQSRDIGASSGANIYFTSEVWTSEDMKLYLLMVSSYEDAAQPVIKRNSRTIEQASKIGYAIGVS